MGDCSCFLILEVCGMMRAIETLGEIDYTESTGVPQCRLLMRLQRNGDVLAPLECDTAPRLHKKFNWLCLDAATGGQTWQLWNKRNAEEIRQTGLNCPRLTLTRAMQSKIKIQRPVISDLRGEYNRFRSRPRSPRTWKDSYGVTQINAQFKVT